MTALQAAAVALVVAAGTGVVFTPDPLRQVMTLAIYGFALTILFFVVQAPDVALSEIVVSGVALPVIVVGALRRIARQQAEAQDGRDADGGDRPTAREPGG